MNLSGGKFTGAYGFYDTYRAVWNLKFVRYVEKIRAENVFGWKSCAVYVLESESDVICYRNGSRNEVPWHRNRHHQDFIFCFADLISLMKTPIHGFRFGENLFKQIYTRYNNCRWNKMDILFHWLKILRWFAMIIATEFSQWISTT